MNHRVVRIGVLGSIVAVGGFVAACGGPSAPQGPAVASSDNPALVTLDLRDGNGQHIGTCTGTLISPSSVLTAGHCLAAASGAVVTKADGQTAYGANVWHTWADFESPWGHPAHSDVGVILLDREMFVSSYPTIARSLAPDGTQLARLRRADPISIAPGNFEAVTDAVHFGTARGFPLAYTMDAASFEGGTDTGGPLIDPSTNTIYGVVSSRGMITGEIYISRVEYLADWADAIAGCSPPPQQAQCHPKPPPTCDGGESSSGGSGSGGSSGGESSSGSGGSGSGSGGSGSGSGGWSSSGGGSGGSGSSSGGWSSSGGGSSGGGGDGGTCQPPPPPPPPPPPGFDGGCSSGGSGGSGSGSGGDQTGSGSGGDQSGSGSGGVTRTPGPGGTYPPLVPDGPGCIDSTCGGCGTDPSCQDGLQDYGNCGCEPPDGGGRSGQTQ